MRGIVIVPIKVAIAKVLHHGQMCFGQLTLGTTSFENQRSASTVQKASIQRIEKMTLLSDFPTTSAPNTAKIGDNKSKILKVRNQDGFVVYFRTKRNHRFRKLMQVYCDKMGLYLDSVHFRFAGQRIYMMDTMASTGMEGGDTIEVYKQ